MGYSCDYCREARSMVYCRSDEAYLCLSCDRNVHSANALSKRHSRTLVCDRCNSQPAVVRCVDEKLSLCQNCDWEGHNVSNSAISRHSRQTLNCYSGCPSAVELSSIWSFMSDSPSVIDSTCEQGIGLMSIADKDRDLSVEDMREGLKSNVWMSSSLVQSGNRPMNVVQQADPKDCSTSKVNLSWVFSVSAVYEFNI
ncbi:zinc finger protein CONSTANS-LIKE 10-like, partial [Cynara cardunculus var. scolymus]|uniref:zinc finger protein CONSTANS-LIKE 10-like n=1 Tax=Cynara cardunculus var. scolymus TaxID=59895 RepID=UPI000D626D73